MLRKLFRKKELEATVSQKQKVSETLDTSQDQLLDAPINQYQVEQRSTDLSDKSADQLPIDKSVIGSTPQKDMFNFSSEKPRRPLSPQDLMILANQNALFWLETSVTIQQYHFKCQQQQSKMMSEYLAHFNDPAQK